MTYQEEKKKKLIIFGSGKVATRFLVNERLNIDGVFDNNKVGDRFWNITITRPMYNSQYFESATRGKIRIYFATSLLVPNSF